MKFRADLNGLRALSVIFVLVYHFSPSLLPGGYIGVDIFFVISGFLMTSIIYKSIVTNQFSLFEFYLRRADRIIPSLFFITIVTSFLGYFVILNPIEMKKLLSHALGTLLFYSNYLYLGELGYFDVLPTEKWFLHTWSLSVEWQFYLLYPILIIFFCFIFGKSNLKFTISFVTITYIASCLFLFDLSDDESYYTLYSRGWEMLIGGLAYFFPINIIRSNRPKIFYICILTILISLFYVNNETAWPGLYSLLPLFAIFLLVSVNYSDQFFLNNRLFQYIGLRSYSIYLCHWVFVVILYYLDTNSDLVFQVIGIILSLVSGFLLYEFFESRFKFFDIFPYFVGTTFIVWILYSYSISPFRYHFLSEPFDTMERGAYPCFDQKLLHQKDITTCTLTSGKKKVVFLGDSHMYSLLPALEEIARNKSFSLEYSGYSACPPLLNVAPVLGGDGEKNCADLNSRNYSSIVEDKVDIVIMAARWTFYTEGDYDRGKPKYLYTLGKDRTGSKQNSVNSLSLGITKTLEYLNDNDIKAIIILQVPMQENSANNIYRKSMKYITLNANELYDLSVDRSKHERFQLKTNLIIIDIASKFSNISIYDPTEQFCDEIKCNIGNENISFYYDDDHLSVSGSKLLIKNFTEVLSTHF